MSYAEAMESVPHIYLSALSWLPERVRSQTMVSSVFRHLSLIKNKRSHWESERWVKNVGARVLSVSYSPDGSLFAAGLGDGTILMMEAQTGETVGEPLKGHQSWVSSAVFSPDGKRIVSGSGDNTIRLWDVASGDAIGRPLEYHSQEVLCVTFSRDGKRIASGSYDNSIKILDAQKLSVISIIDRPIESLEDGINSVAFSEDGKRVVSGSTRGMMCIWNCETGAPISEALLAHSWPIRSVVYSPDGLYIASGSGDSTIKLWDGKTGALIGAPLKGHTQDVESVCFSADSKKIASGSSDGSICLWDVQTRSKLGESLLGHADWIYSVAFAPNGGSILSASLDGSVRAWDIQHTAAADAKPHHQSNNKVNFVACSPGGQFIASSFGGSQINVWNLRTGLLQCLLQDGLSHSDTRSLSMVFLSDNQHLISCSSTGFIGLWNVSSGHLSSVTHLSATEEHNRVASTIALSRDDSLIALGSQDGFIHLVNMDQGRIFPGEGFKGHKSQVNSVTFSPDNSKLVSGSNDQLVTIWNVQDINPNPTPEKPAVGRVLSGHSGGVNSVAISPDGRWVAASSTRGFAVCIWEITTGELIHRLENYLQIAKSVTFSPDGQYVVYGGAQTVTIWSTQTGKDVSKNTHFRRQPSKWLDFVTFSPNGERIMVGYNDKTVHVWDSMYFGLTALDQSTGINRSNNAFTPRAHQRHWYSCCSRLTTADGWVKDGDKLLIWIPIHYRENIAAGLKLVIGGDVRRSMKPEVDTDKLYEYSGTGWTRIYNPPGKEI